LLCIAIVFLLHSAVTIWNDLCDHEVDAKNDRPFIADIRGTQLHRHIVVATVTIMLFSVGLSLLVSWSATGIVVAALIASWLYNARPYSGSRRPIASILLLSGTSSFVPFVLGYLLGGGLREAILLGVAWWLMRISLSLLKDYKDASGDATTGKRTFLLAYGSSQVRRYSAVTFGIGALALVGLLVVVLASLAVIVFAAYRYAVLAPADYSQMHRHFVQLANYQLILEAGLITWLWYS
jgi:4-hydroxybenzoate polyprenyltransferase